MKSDENMNLETQTKLFGMSEAMKQGMNLGLELGEKAAGEKGTVGTASFRMPEDKKKNLKENLQWMEARSMVRRLWRLMGSVGNLAHQSRNWRG